ncbi:rhomboid family intramembrane serine protease [Candidatus Pacearchaeota archaeon]|nr:rhomboid family intramembrane serine protease [Candidatus Pacearchaeota archaeon]
MVIRRDFRREQRPTGFFSRFSATHLIIFINVVAFFLFLVLSSFISSIFDFVAIKPSFILSGTYIWTVVTSVFMHGGFLHLFVNMFSLFFLGSLAERIIGRKRFIWFYLVAGIFGSLFFVLFAYIGTYFSRGDFIFGGIDDFAVGASGAIFGLLGILATLLPRKKIFLIVGPLIVIVLQFLLGKVFPSISGVVDIVGTILIFLMIFSMFSLNSSFRKISMPLSLSFWLAPIVAIVPLLVIGFFVKLPIGNMAHLGGLVAGLIYGAYLRSKYQRKVKMLNRMIK